MLSPVGSGAEIQGRDGRCRLNYDYGRPVPHVEMEKLGEMAPLGYGTRRRGHSCTPRAPLPGSRGALSVGTQKLIAS
jgi:hypothetical protein